MDKNHVEALLFVSKEPLSLDQIAKTVEEDKDIVLRWLIELQSEYFNRGIRIRQVAGGFEMVTAVDVFDVVEKVVPKEYEYTLSKAAFETIAIIVQHQPINAYQIAKKRGVKNSEHTIQTLLDQNLIKQTEEGYTTTDYFLKYFGINDLKELKEKLITIPLEKKIVLNPDEVAENEAIISVDGNETTLSVDELDSIIENAHLPSEQDSEQDDLEKEEIKSE